ncbi:MAG: hypothetical protein V4666_07930 [Bacteroidota bacterium]
MTKQFYNFILIVTTGFALSSCSTRLAKCPPDGRPVRFPRSEKFALKAYQDAVNDFNVNLKATVNVAEKVTVGVDKLEVKNESTLLKEKLNQRSIRLQDILKASYLGLATDPCLFSERHFKLVESVNIFNKELEELTIKLEAQLKQSELSVKEKEIGSTLNDYLYQRGKKEGTAMGQLAKMLDNYYLSNQKYPESIEKVDAKDLILILGSSRLEYKIVKDNEYLLRFAGEDYMLGSSDDKIQKGIDGKTEKVQ